MSTIRFRAVQKHASLNRQPGVYPVSGIEWYDNPDDEGHTGEVFLKGYDDSEYLDEVTLIETIIEDRDVPIIERGDTVTHDFSKMEGEVLDIRDDPKGYNYLVRWTGYLDSDWYQASVLKVTPISERTSNAPN